MNTGNNNDRPFLPIQCRVGQVRLTWCSFPVSCHCNRCRFPEAVRTDPGPASHLLPSSLRSAPSAGQVIKSRLIEWHWSRDQRRLYARVPGVWGMNGSFFKDTNGTFSWLCRKCVTAMGQLLIHVHSSMRRPTLVCTLLPWKHKTGQEQSQQLLPSTTEMDNSSPSYSKDREFRGKSNRNKMLKISQMKNVSKQVVILFKGASWN